MSTFREISPYELTSNPFTMIGKDWMLVSAADSTAEAAFGKNYNTMTASWGGVGVLWNKPVAFVFIRPERNTFLFTEDSDYMTLSFFGGEKRDILSFCGRNSGRDVDKAEKCGLTPVFEEEEQGRSVYFEEASCVLKVRRLYGDSIKTDKFYDESPMDFYRTDGLHKMYVCEIEKVLVK